VQKRHLSYTTDEFIDAIDTPMRHAAASNDELSVDG
jgi:hypothetical protein